GARLQVTLTASGLLHAGVAAYWVSRTKSEINCAWANPATATLEESHHREEESALASMSAPPLSVVT
ncbi:MAG: hypothetical protein KGO05_06445, partial [Chloroflexota bacterium]|nr:hypothetical protein [Chloroflexota bacterium]